ncbi:MAG: hypothetical protein E6J81_18870 [Deltaproteobacteria bacterium]|nr:MAG: hypothetical protein E6J81_18870 [Deltaproteobacteria bacterium]
MRSSVLLAETLLALGVFAAPYSAAARCRLQVKLAGGSALTRQARCVDGDPACDSDSKPDSTCDFQAKLCFSTDAVTACDQADLLGMSIPSVPGLGGLPNLFEKFKTSATPGTLCTDAATVTVPTNGKKKGQVVMKVLATHGSQRFAFVCQRPKGPKPPKGATFGKDIQKKIFDSTCATTFCHGTGAASGGLDLSDGAAYANLVGVLATNEAAKAANLQRVLPNDPADSFLLLKLEGTLAAGEGVPMPLVGGPLPASAIDTIRRWIAAGASETAPF